MGKSFYTKEKERLANDVFVHLYEQCYENNCALNDVVDNWPAEDRANQWCIREQLVAEFQLYHKGISEFEKSLARTLRKINHPNRVAVRGGFIV